ncbi:UDP-3-O-[3-hydroxymyristoyl] glucosamine N-acyltransferase [hydrothermal vent metagenome]|uniref:UDP-3-O-[3-hydroxymyristoyl] glucosamine N-acyltransferase n=1 Tax=hydrothermal vent metagenome TaxID=652676 RepID=A0A3B0Z3D9_9ZZZZ
MAITVAQLALQLDGRIVGDADGLINSVATLDHALPGQLTFLANTKYQHQLAETTAGAVLVRESEAAGCPVTAIIVNDPYLSYAKAVASLYPEHREPGGIHPQATVDESASIDPSAWIGANVVVEAGATIGQGVQISPGCVIGRNVDIGVDTRLHANVSLYAEVKIGERCLLHSGVVIGSDGFGFANENGHWLKIQQIGRVIVGNDVEIGANCAIDSGAIGDTIIEDGVKLDNLIQIAHNVRIGAHTAIAGHSAVAGSSVIGKHCAIGGAVGIVGHLDICDNVTITAMSLVSKSISEPGVYSSGLPVEGNREWNKRVARLGQLGKLNNRVSQLEKLKR